MIKVIESVTLIRLITQLPEYRQNILFTLLRIQEIYRRVKILNIFCLGTLFLLLKKIDKEYNRYPIEIELLHKLYLITL